MSLLKYKAVGMVLALVSSVSFGDDITDAVEEGLSGYKSGDLTKAAAQLDYASTLIRQKKAEKITAVFPDATTGWKAEEVSSEASAAMLGGGITAERYYSKGEEVGLEIEMVMDSPALQSMLAMFSNPAMIAMGGGKVIKIQGNTAKVEEDGDEIELMFVVNNNAMITLTGSGASLKEVKAYAELLHLDKLK